MKSSVGPKKIIIILTIIIAVIVFLVGSYSIWQVIKIQANENVIVVGESSCMKLTFTEGNAIEINNAFPKTDAEGIQNKPLAFEIKNECGESVQYEVHLEVLDTSDINSQYIKSVLNSDPIKKTSQYMLATPELAYTDEAYILNGTRVINPDEIHSYNYRMWIDENTPQEMIAGKSYYSKIVIVINKYTPSLIAIWMRNSINELSAAHSINCNAGSSYGGCDALINNSDFRYDAWQGMRFATTLKINLDKIKTVRIRYRCYRKYSGVYPWVNFSFTNASLGRQTELYDEGLKTIDINTTTLTGIQTLYLFVQNGDCYIEDIVGFL